MITFITGREGSGKSYEIDKRIIDDLANHRSVILIAPESQGVSTESRISTKAIASEVPLINLTVTSFTGLANICFRTYGGLCYNYAGTGAKKLILWKALNKIKSALKEYAKVSLSDDSVLAIMLQTIERLKSQGILPEALLLASSKMEEKSASGILSAKVYELGIIYASYIETLKETFDDPTDDLPRFNALLEHKDFFKNKSVYFDSFDRFYGVQMRTVYQAIRQADNVTISMPLDLENYKEYGDMYTNILNSYREIRRIANDFNKEIEDIYLKTNYRANNNELVLLSNNIWNDNVNESVFDKPTENIKLFECHDVFSQAEAVAIEIMKSITRGESFSDNIIISRDLNKYKGVIDAVLSKYDIPCFVSHKIELIDQTIVKAAMMALSIVINDFKTDDIIAYLKTGYSGLSIDDCDALEEYAITWSINGSDWTSEDEWMMNPEGFSDQISQKQLNEIEYLNRIKTRLITPLLSLKEGIFGGKTVRECTKAMVEFLNRLDIISMLDTDEDIETWNALTECFQGLVDAVGEEEVLPTDYYRLLSLIIKDSHYKTIPTSKDEVLFVDAKNVYTGIYKNCYIIGSVEGEFPATVSDNDFFSDTEKEQLEDEGITIADLCVERIRDEFFYYQRSICLSTDNLSVFYYNKNPDGSSAKPSYAINRIRLLYPSINFIKFEDIDNIDTIYSPNATFDHFLEYKKGELGEALTDIYSSMPEYEQKLRALTIPLKTKECSISPDTANALFGKDLQMAATRLEAYAQCHFKYFCDKILRLSEHKKADFKAIQIGNYSHKILEIFIKEFIEKNKELTEEEIEEIVDRIISNYLNEVFKYSKAKTNRMEQLFKRLKKNSILLVHSIIDELKQSEFIPSYFEFEIGNNSTIKPYRVSLSDGSFVELFGKIDRVDISKLNGKLYVRIIDYKTGTHNFVFDDAKSGTSLQILLYLMTICKNASEDFITQSGGEGKEEILPAGGLYVSVSPTDVNAEPSEADDEIIQKAMQSMKREGFLLDDIDVLRQMEKDLGGKYIPVTLKKDEISSKSTVSMETLNSMFDEVEKTVTKLIEELKKGNANASPQKFNKIYSPCDFCSAKYICRNPQKTKTF